MSISQMLQKTQTCIVPSLFKINYTLQASAADHVDSSKTFAFRATNRHEVKSVLEQVKSNKAKGHDSIPPRALKASAPTIAQPLSDLIRAHKHNYCKVGSTTNLETRRHKKDSLLEKTNYRPITVLPAFSKVFERILHIQMSKHFEFILDKYMFAYRKFHGCPAALLTLTEQWKAELDKHNVIGA